MIRCSRIRAPKCRVRAASRPAVATPAEVSALIKTDLVISRKALGMLGMLKK